MRRWHAWVIAGLLAGTGLACDDGNDVPPEVLRARQIAQEQDRRAAELAATKPAPTTRELLTGKKKTVRLAPLPLSLEAPESWALGSLGNAGNIITLSGPAGSGEITIQLMNQGQAVSVGAMDTSLASARKEAASKPLPINKVELRPLGPGKLLEQRMLSGDLVDGRAPVEVWGEVDTGIKDPTTGGNLMTRAITNPQLIKWQFTYLHPAGDGKLSAYGLNFMSLRLAEFEQDREFLEQMMGTLKYEGEVGGGQ